MSDSLLDSWGIAFLIATNCDVERDCFYISSGPLLWCIVFKYFQGLIPKIGHLEGMGELVPLGKPTLASHLACRYLL